MRYSISPSSINFSFRMQPFELLILLSAAFVLASCDFTPDFNAFLTKTYGPAMRNLLERKDLQNRGSFGGRAKAGQKLKNQPVILVHGITNSASQFRDIGQHFVSKGYNWAEIYATTWGDAGKTVFLFVDLKCQYVKQVRSMIAAVHRYTGMKVDVIGYSMGSPLARKAIMGGQCVDTGENLGGPLTGIVDTFVGVAGANYGVASCFFPIPIGVCNGLTGLSCGSRFLSDINSRQRYEGSFIYSIYSPQDDKVGYQACGQLASAIAGQNGGFQQSGNHDTVLHSTKELQRKLVLAHRA